MCKVVLSDDFTYYSIDANMVNVLDNLSTKTSEDESFDICDGCFKKITSQLGKGVGFCCDVTGEVFDKKKCSYYSSKVNKCEVNFSSQNYTCSKCNIEKKVEEVPCGGCDRSTVLVKKAVVSVSHVVDLNISSNFIATLSNNIAST